MHVRHLSSVDGDLVVDFEAGSSGELSGGLFVEGAVTLDSTKQLARAATMRAALFEERLAGAAVGVRPRLVDSAEETRLRIAEELRSMDIDPDRFPEQGSASGRTAVVAAAAWLGGLDGRTVAIEGFGPRAETAAHAVASRGGRLVGISSPAGAVADAAGIDTETVLDARSEHGDLFVTMLGLELHRADELFGLAVDVLVTTGGVASLGPERASTVGARVLAPTDDAAYTAAGIDVLRRRQVVPVPDFVCAAGPFLEAHAPPGLPAEEVRARADRLVHERIDGARLAKIDPVRYASALADTFLTTWVPADQRPDGVFVDA